MQLRTAASGDEHPLGVRRRFRDDVDHTVDRVGTQQGRAGAADDFNPVDILQQRILHFPEDARVERCVSHSPVDQHKQLVGARAVESARADGPRARVNLCHLKVRSQS